MQEIASPMVLAISFGWVIFCPFISMFNRGTPYPWFYVPCPSIFSLMFWHISFDMYLSQLFILLARMTCLVVDLLIWYSCKLAFVGNLFENSLRDCFRSKIACLHSSENGIRFWYRFVGNLTKLVYKSRQLETSIKIIFKKGFRTQVSKKVPISPVKLPLWWSIAGDDNGFLKW